MTTTAAGPGEARTPEPYVRPDLYDLLFSGLRFDHEFYLGLARAAGGPVLDLCCGTGRVLVPLLEAGVDADGVDLYPEMLERARANAAAQGRHPKLYAADMRAFETPRRYALVMIPFNAFAHNLTVEDQLNTLSCCHRQLERGGMLAFDAFTATAEMLRNPAAEPVLEMEVVHPDDGHLVQLWDGRNLDPLAQTQHSKIEVRELSPDRTPLVTHRFETVVRWVWPAELELLLRLAGFSASEVFGGFDRRPVSAETASLVVLARKGGAEPRVNAERMP